MMLLENRVALVTGASRGIGEATAKVLAKRGARVAVSARTVSDLECLATSIREEGGQALVVPGDVLDAAQVQEMINRVVEEWGGWTFWSTMPDWAQPPCRWKRSRRRNGITQWP